tara:strand:- start:4648 stop:7716 length:3069 start_codon:yes stop_codon:yes gene_type:complete
MAIQLIIYPQLYDGFHSFTGPSSILGGSGSGQGTNSTVQRMAQPQVATEEMMANPSMRGQTPEINTVPETTSGIVNSLNTLSNFPAPVGMYKLGVASNVVKAPKYDKALLVLSTDTGTNTNTNGSAFIYSTVNGLQSGNSYRVMITVESSDISNMRLGSVGGNTWDVNGNSMSQLGGKKGMIQGTQWCDAANGQLINNPLGTAITSQKIFYQDFIAENSTEVLQLSVQNNTASITNFSRLSVVASTHNYQAQGNSQARLSAQQYISDGQVILDLYKDESIPLNLSVDNFTDVAEKVASYSKAFMLPATKRNNRIFSHYFDVTRSQNHDQLVFNPYVQTTAVIKDDTVIVFEGFLKMINVQEKDGQISYNVNCYSEPTTFCDYLKAGVIGSLDLAELGHEYYYDNVEDSWTSPGLTLSAPLLPGTLAGTAGSIRTEVIKYPLVNWTGQYTMIDNDTMYSSKLENSFRPFIQCKYLLDKMFEATPFSYESNFLNTTAFTKLFMDFNWGGESASLQEYFLQSQDAQDIGPYSTVNVGNWEPIQLPTTDEENPSGVVSQVYDPISGVVTVHADNLDVKFGFNLKFRKDIINVNGQVRIRRWSFATSTTTTLFTWNINDFVGGIFPPCAWQAPGGLPVIPDTDQCGAMFISGTHTDVNRMMGDKIWLEFRATGGDATGNLILSNNDAVSTWSQPSWELLGSGPSILRVTFTGGASTLAVLMQGMRGQMKQYDFWLGIKQMFNLVTMPHPTQPNHLIIEPYTDVFLKNPDTKLWDWTNKMDTKSIKQEPLNKIPKTTHFTYKEDEKDYRVAQYKSATSGYLYGTKTWTAGAQFFSVLAGETTIEAKPFAPTLVAPINGNSDWHSLTTSHIYSANDEGTEFKSYDNKPRILYDNGVKPLLNGKTLETRDTVGNWWSGNKVITNFGQMSHLSDCPTIGGTLDYNFGECPLVNPVGLSPIRNLFEVYWKPYYDELYNPDTRVVKMKMALTPQDLNNFRFWDVVLIKNRTYRVNTIKYNSGTLAQVELILIT